MYTCIDRVKDFADVAAFNRNNMSWLNTASIANLAKSALKEAQKTIDKALDIRDADGVAKQSVDNGKK